MGCDRRPSSSLKVLFVTTDPITAALLRYLCSPLIVRGPVPLNARLLPIGVEYADQHLVVMVSPHTGRIHGDGLERISSHYAADVIHGLHRRDGAIVIDIAMRTVSGAEVIRDLSLARLDGALWLLPDKRRIWARIEGDGARLSGRAPVGDQSVLKQGRQRALDELAALAHRLALTVQLRRD